MPKGDTISTFGIATRGSAYNFWLDFAQAADKVQCISSILYELDEMVNPLRANSIEFSRESFLKNYDWNSSYLARNLAPKDVFEYIDFEKGYIEDESLYMQYWRDLFDGPQPGIWEFDDKDPNTATIVLELAVGGPNAHLLYIYNIKEMAPYPHINNGLEKIKLEYHWWSPLHIIDLTKCPKNANAEERLMHEAANECLDQIYESMYDAFKR